MRPWESLRRRAGGGRAAGRAGRIDEAMGFFRQFAGVLDSHLRGRDHVVGDGLTVADFALASFLPHARDAKLPLDEFAQISRWYARLEQLPAWREPFPTPAASAA